MLYADPVRNSYFEWMLATVCRNRFSEEISYRKLFTLLHNTPFRYSIPRDANRAEDGIDLRYRFAYYEMPDVEDIESYLRGPCSVFEMMLALAIRCEETIMDDPLQGDRTGQWFWGMVNTLGLGGMYDARFDKKMVDEIVDRFLNRDYDPDGKGGLFRIRNSPDDLRKVEIWYQLCWYLDSIV